MFTATHLLINMSIGPDTPVHIVKSGPFAATVQDEHGNLAKIAWSALRPITKES